MTDYEEYPKQEKDNELTGLFRLYICGGLTKTKELGYLPPLVQNRLNMMNKEFERIIKNVSDV